MASAIPASRPSPAKPREAFLPYGRQLIEDDDIAAVTAALQSDYLTTGPLVERFEQNLASVVGARNAVACTNGTAALYLAARALGLGAGSLVVVPAMTFLATASAPHLAGAEILFADVDPESGLMRPDDLEMALRHMKADAVFPVHFAGQTCDMAAIAQIARNRGLRIVEDAAHALGAAFSYGDTVVPVGACLHSDLTIFSFHPVKTIAMGEGGAVSVNDPELLKRLRQFRNHGITRDPETFVSKDAFDAHGGANPWFYELIEPGFNWRVSDINCALGISQLAKLPRFVSARGRLVAAYDELLAELAPLVRPIARVTHSSAAWHLYAVKIDFSALKLDRAQVMTALREVGIGTQVHYIPVHRQPYYARRYGALSLPGAEAYYARTLSLPLFAGMTIDDVERVVRELRKALAI